MLQRAQRLSHPRSTISSKEIPIKKWGGYLFFFGAGSVVLSFLSMDFIVLSWIDMWGPTVGWMIRGAMIVAGGGLWLIGRQQEGAQLQAAQGKARYADS